MREIPVQFQRKDKHDLIDGMMVEDGSIEVSRFFDRGQVRIVVPSGPKVREIRLTVENTEALIEALQAQIRILREGYEAEVPIYTPVPYDPKTHHGLLTGLDIGGVFHVEVQTGTEKRWVHPPKTGKTFASHGGE